MGRLGSSLRTGLFILCLFGVGACGTAVKTHETGRIDVSKVDGQGHPLAPVVLTYKFEVPSEGHELFILDQRKNRFNIRVSDRADTESGVLIYLPAGRRYSLSGMLLVKGWTRTEVSFGKDLPLFLVRAGEVTLINYFEVRPKESQGFVLDVARKDSLQDIISRDRFAKKFDYSGHTRSVKALEQQ